MEEELSRKGIPGRPLLPSFLVARKKNDQKSSHCENPRIILSEVLTIKVSTFQRRRTIIVVIVSFRRPTTVNSRKSRLFHCRDEHHSKVDSAERIIFFVGSAGVVPSSLARPNVCIIHARFIGSMSKDITHGSA